MLQFPARFGRIHLISWGLTTRVYGCEVHDFVGSFTSVAHNVAQEIINGPQHGPGGSPVVRAAFIAVHNKSAALKKLQAISRQANLPCFEEYKLNIFM